MNVEEDLETKEEYILKIFGINMYFINKQSENWFKKQSKIRKQLLNN
jgi:hypothetical protein